MSLQYLHKSIVGEDEFLPTDKHKNFLQDLVSLWVLARKAQSIKNNQFTISLQYLKENMKDEVHFWPAGKC